MLFSMVLTIKCLKNGSNTEFSGQIKKIPRGGTIPPRSLIPTSRFYDNVTQKNQWNSLHDPIKNSFLGNTLDKK